MRVYNNSDVAQPVGRTVIPPKSEAFVDDAYLLTPWAKKMRKAKILVFPYYGKIPWEEAEVVKAAAEEPIPDPEEILATEDPDVVDEPEPPEED